MVSRVMEGNNNASAEQSMLQRIPPVIPNPIDVVLWETLRAWHLRAEQSTFAALPWTTCPCSSNECIAGGAGCEQSFAVGCRWILKM